jgi:hypothetical protein
MENTLLLCQVCLQRNESFNTIVIEIQLHAYSQKGLEIISLVLSVRLLAARLEKRRPQMDEFVRNFVLGMNTKSCLCFPILHKIDQSTVNYMRRATCAYKICLSNWLFSA